MKVKLPKEIASEVGCSEVMIRKINQGTRRPSPGLAGRIIETMRRRDVEIDPADLLPDLAEIFKGNGDSAAGPDGA